MIIQTSSGNRFNGEVVNISMGGAFIKCTAPIEFGQEIEVQINMAEARMLHGKVIENETWLKQNAASVVTGRSVVKWARGSSMSGLGIEFTNLSAKEKEFIEKLIHYCDKLNPEK